MGKCPISDETLDIMFLSAISMFQQEELKYNRENKVPRIMQTVEASADRWCDYWKKRLQED